jgi:hypothetical protein
MFCDGGTWGIVHTFLKNMVKDFLVAVAADAGGRVFNVVVEAKRQLATNNRTGDVAGCDNGVQFAIDVFVTRVGSVSNNGNSVDKVIEEADAVKRGYYAKQCTDSGVFFFTFDIFFLLIRTLLPSKGCSPRSIRIPGIYSYIISFKN